ncbi:MULTISPECIES: hypothetical protein [unclassified Microcoleus]|uniref:hypothetical protein n=1 Tax=unclassified Microcoleus TaxID=2642155 RepID=UPI002FD1393E
MPSPRKCDRATLNFSASPVGYAGSTKHLTVVFERIFWANLAFNSQILRSLHYLSLRLPEILNHKLVQLVNS